MPTSDHTQTTTAMLAGLHDPANEQVWRAFDDRFRPIIVAFAGRLGAQAEDAADVAQETLSQFLRDFRAGKYDRSRGRLHAWIVGIARHRLIDLQRRRAAQRERRGESAIAELPAEGELSQLWDAECREEILRAGLRELRETRLDPNTIRAFEMVALEESTPAAAAAALGLTVDSVYAAKNRCLAQLRTILARLHDAYEVSPE